MPYWNRQDHADRTLNTYAKFYGDLSLEVIVVDDGSPVPFQTEHEFVKIIRLPDKTVSKNPCVPFNIGVRESCGDVIVLTNPENNHREPILLKMLTKLVTLGEKGYVAACCWAVEHKRWLVHQTVNRYDKIPLPENGHFHMCAMLYKDFYQEIGGFDEAYRDGAGYDDNDLLKKLEQHGANFHLCHDLIVDHYLSSSQWTQDANQRNEKIFLDKWKLSA